MTYADLALLGDQQVGDSYQKVAILEKPYKLTLATLQFPNHQILKFG